MCETCGCGDTETTLVNLQTGLRHFLNEHVHADGTRHSHSHAHADHSHEHGQGNAHESGETVELNARILAKNDRAAARNRGWLKDRGVLALNLMSGPGSGKTTLIERTIAEMKSGRRIYVLEGDQATAHDAERVKAAGAIAAQINTGRGCHLDAEMVDRGLKELQPDSGSLLVIENVGNLVCPALFDLGEAKRVAILSVTEGDDKPLKYPHMFRAADLMLLNKVDLLPYVDFDPERAISYARDVNPGIEVLTLSARTGEGVVAWVSWLERAAEQAPVCEL